VSADFWARAAAGFGVREEPAGARGPQAGQERAGAGGVQPSAACDSRSGASVRPVRTSEGRKAYLKVTPATLGPQKLAAARRELRFYRELAPATPVPTPALLGGHDTPDGVSILLADAGKTRPAADWTEPMWAALGRELAHLHRMPRPPGADWNRPDALDHALTSPDIAAITAFWSPVLPQLPRLLARRAEFTSQLAMLPPAFVHGDCHTANLLPSPSGVTFCDWQSVGVGRVSSDLAFPGVRAASSGVTVPHALVEAYLQTMPGDPRMLRRALLAEELAVFVFLWPPYAAFNDAAAITRVHRRAQHLADQW
jgi:aminoglycoside phosphotransferase (APT) family kinase protein